MSVSWNCIAVFLAIVAAGFAYELAPFANEKPMVALVAAIFPLLGIALFHVPALQCLPPGPRVILVLLALRPLVDMSFAFQTVSPAFTLKASSELSLQEAFAAVFGLAMFAVSIAQHQRIRFTNAPNIFLMFLVGLTSISWVIGGLAEGTRGFARTVWGLLVALLLGTLFQTEKQIDVFLRAVFYSSALVLMTLALNLSSGLAGDRWEPVFRLGGQYGSPNALAGVALSFFLVGLYVVGRAPTASRLIWSFLLLLLLAAAIYETQSRTVGALMLLSVCIRLWASRQRLILFGVTAPLLAFLFLASSGTGWRLLSSFSLASNQGDTHVLTLQGRTLLWGIWLENYMRASVFHKAFGLGWGVMLRKFLSMGFPTSSVTESSFLWLFIGTGALGLLSFCAYLVWVLSKSWCTWRNSTSNFQREFALLIFLATVCFVVECFTTDVASSPNANVYIFSLMSIFVLRRVRETRSIEL